MRGDQRREQIRARQDNGIDWQWTKKKRTMKGEPGGGERVEQGAEDMTTESLEINRRLDLWGIFRRKRRTVSRNEDRKQKGESRRKVVSS